MCKSLLSLLLSLTPLGYVFIQPIWFAFVSLSIHHCCLSVLCIWLWNISPSVLTPPPPSWQRSCPAPGSSPPGWRACESFVFTGPVAHKKISYRLPLIYACCCCSSANEAVCDHGTAPSTLELRLPRHCLTPESQRGHAHITLPNVLSLSQVSTSPFCLHADICYH